MRKCSIFLLLCCRESRGGILCASQYGVQKARDAYNGLHDAYAAAGWTDEQIDTVLQMQTPDNAFFDAQGLHVYHAAANVVFDDADILNWIVSKHK